jgi:hypothetical protein
MYVCPSTPNTTPLFPHVFVHRTWHMVCHKVRLLEAARHTYCTVLPRSAQLQLCVCARKCTHVRVLGHYFTVTELTCVDPPGKGRNESGEGSRPSLSGMPRGSSSAASGRKRRASPRPAMDSKGWTEGCRPFGMRIRELGGSGYVGKTMFVK